MTLHAKSQLNDPEYRWLHKEEMATIMPFVSERNRLGVVVIDYEKRRAENNSTIKPNNERDFDWVIFKSLVERVPYNIDRSKSKTSLQPSDRLHFEKRDRGVCKVCGCVSKYTICHLHHVIPNGDVSETNIITLCVHCHQIVHQALYLTGRWKFSRPT
jgi:hypothetical protein